MKPIVFSFQLHVLDCVEGCADFLGIGMMVAVLKWEGTVSESEMLKMSVITSAS